MYTLLMKDKIFLNFVLYMVHFGCHGNVNFNKLYVFFFFFLFCFVLSIVRSDICINC